MSAFTNQVRTRCFPVCVSINLFTLPVSWIGSDLPNKMPRDQFLHLKARINKLLMKSKMDHALLLAIIDNVNLDSLLFIVFREIIIYLRVQLLSGHKQVARRTIYLVHALIKKTAVRKSTCWLVRNYSCGP